MNPQGILILSYLPSYSTGGCGRGCCPSTTIGGDFAYHFAETEEAAATFIANRIQGHIDEDWLHILLDDWASAAQLGSNSLCECRGADSIQIPYFDVDDEFTQAKEQRRDRIRALVTKRLEELKAATRERERLAAKAQRAAEDERARQRELAEYQRLQKKFG